MEAALYLSVQQFLFWEARLLDERRFDEWLALFSDDSLYWMPVRHNRLRESMDEKWEPSKEIEDESGLGYFEDNKSRLTRRVGRLKTGMAWAEDPPSRTRHLISNIEVERNDNPSEVVARSSFLTYRSRNEGKNEDEDLFSGSREDVLRKNEDADSWLIVNRKIIPDWVVVNAQNLSIFF
ncbi:uncharacterized protein METZ01_LOCUS31222 [marine metagenome]|uniref:Uncharacterized protein n=1 Tax=marine metagenome TaxID=408172 RepID=A0A381QHD3_9ZZZZ